MGERAESVALIAGAGGLTGGLLLAALLEAPEFTRVYAVTRRPLPGAHPRLANRIVQFDRLEEQLRGVACQTAFCCLGVSPEASAEEARVVELGHSLAFARAAKRAGADRFVYLSCAGAHPQAVRMAQRFKREAEHSLETLGFTSLDILQPGALLGVRREIRPSDIAAFAAAPFVLLTSLGARAPRRAVSARTVAAAMLGAARSRRRGVYRYTYSGIRTLANAKPSSRTARADLLGS